MAKEGVKVAAISMCSGSDKKANVAKAVAYLREAHSQGAEWLVLPEIFPFHGPYHQVYAMAETEGQGLVRELQHLSAELKVVIFAGSMGERPASGEDSLNSRGEKRVYNTCWVFGRQGEILGKYRKTHLFNLKGPDGAALYCEAEGFIAGDEQTVLEIEGYRVGLSICYDLRFAPFYHLLEKDGPLDVIMAPSAFTKMTGAAHWELLLRARAIEHQAYVVAADQVGQHAPGKESFGHSMIVDPWGQVLSNTGAAEGIAYAEINKKSIAEVRARLPVLGNRRPDLY